MPAVIVPLCYMEYTEHPNTHNRWIKMTPLLDPHPAVRLQVHTFSYVRLGIGPRKAKAHQQRTANSQAIRDTNAQMNLCSTALVRLDFSRTGILITTASA